MTLAGIRRLKTERVQVIATTKPERALLGFKLEINDDDLIGLFIHANPYVGVSNRYYHSRSSRWAALMRLLFGAGM